MALAAAIDRLRSWHVVVAVLLVHTALGGWVLWTGVRSGASIPSEVMGTVIGAILLVIVGVAALFLLAALWMLYVGRISGSRSGTCSSWLWHCWRPFGAFCCLAAVWPLPALLAVATVFAWQERTTETE